MGKLVLSKAAIKQIILLRRDESKSYSYAEIAQIIHRDFGINVAPNSIRRAYLKHKDTLDVATVSVKPNLTTQNQPEPPAEPKPARKSFIKPPEQKVQIPDGDDEPEYIKISKMGDKEFMEYLKERKRKKEAQ